MDQLDTSATLSAAEKRTIKQKLFRGGGARGSGFVLNRVLLLGRVVVFARLFSPHDLGVFALVVSCVTVIAVLGNFGVKQNIVRQHESSDALINSSYTFSWLLGVVLVVALWLTAPLFSYIFSEQLSNYIRFTSLLVLIIPLQFPGIFWEKELNFVQPTLVQLINNFIAVLLTIVVEVIWHAGVWSLLIGTVCAFLMASAYTWLMAPMRPKWEFHRQQLSGLMNFGFPYMVQALNGQVMARGDNLIVGALTNPTQLAFYNFAWQLPMMVSDLASRLDTMLLPVYGRVNEDVDTLKKLFNLSNKVWSVLGAVVGFLILLYADVIVLIMYGDQWAAAVPFLRIMTLSFTIRFCTGYAYDNLVLVRGRTTYMMKWGLVNTVLVFTLGYILIARFGAIGGSWFWVIQAIVLIPLVRFPLIYQELGELTFLKHIWQPLLSGFIAFGLVFALDYEWPLMMWWRFARGTTLFLALFVFFLYVIDRRFYRDVWQLLKQR